MTRKLFFIPVLLISIQLVAQDNIPAVPPVTIADFSPISPLVNKETDAVVLLDSGSSSIDADPHHGFFVTYYHFKRILILNKKALDEEGKISIGFSVEMNGKRLKNLKAVTYNLENGKISKVSPQEKDFYVEDSKNDYRQERFAFTNAKEGSIIEFEYSNNIDTYALMNWNFQGYYPRMKSIYTVKVPDGFNYAMQFQNKKLQTDTRMNSLERTFYSYGSNYENTPVHVITWIYDNVAPMRKEAFTSTIDNYICCVKFQLSARPGQPGTSVTVLNDWPWLTDRLMNDEDFGKAMAYPSSMIKKQARLFAGENNSELEKAEGIYNNVRDHFKVSGYGLTISGNQTLTEIYKTGVGNVAEINMILIAMLKSQDIKADPVILATRDNGLTNQTYPVLDNYNYLICRAVVGGREYFLDASEATMGFGKLPTECYNGHARVIAKQNFPVFLAPDSLKESEHITADIHQDSQSKSLILEWRNHTGYYASSDLRKELKNKTIVSIFEKETELIPFKKTVDSFSISDLKNLDEPLTLYFKLSLDPGNASTIYFNPLLNSGMKENPFKSAIRSYPVEMPYVSDNRFELNMEIPAGYDVDELPKSEKFLLNESDGFYEYQVEKNGIRIHVKSTMVLNKAIFEPEDYNRLKDFYSNMIRKQSEMIVFKRKI
jgi:hypothetical protein